jgi:hypothetical protein
MMPQKAKWEEADGVRKKKQLGDLMSEGNKPMDM